MPEVISTIFMNRNQITIGWNHFDSSKWDYIALKYINKYLNCAFKYPFLKYFFTQKNNVNTTISQTE